MFVNTNVAALNAWRNLENTQNDMKGVLQQLSSGYRINTAADDPAGLAISQQMQSQIGGLNQAYLNSQSGVSLLQTADGALGQIQNILQSMRSLASEASTATMNPTDTQNLQTEMNQYTQEITQITNTTQFNNINLLGGSFTGQNLQVGANQGQSLGVSLSAADAYSLGVTGLSTNVTADASTVIKAGTSTAAGYTPAAGYTLAQAQTDWSVSSSTGSATALTGITGAYTNTTNDSIALTAITTDASKNGTAMVSINGAAATSVSISTGSATIDGLTFNFAASQASQAINLTLNAQSTAFTFKNAGATTLATSTVNGPLTVGTQETVSGAGGSFGWQVGTALNPSSKTVAYASFGSAGTTTTSTATITLAQSGSAASSYTNGTGNASAGTGIDITNQANAQTALTIIDNAINNLSTQRANVGAYQNRLQFAASDVQTVSQNLEAARAGIMDADMAQTMSNLSRDQVLMQSGVAMLAQANSVPQALLKLMP